MAGASEVVDGDGTAGAESQQSLDGSSVVVVEPGAEGSAPFVQQAILRVRPGLHHRDDEDNGNNGGGTADGEFVHVDAAEGADGSAHIQVIAGAVVPPPHFRSSLILSAAAGSILPRSSSTDTFMSSAMSLVVLVNRSA